LGKYIYFDASLSASAGQFARGGAMTQSCASCHLPQQGYAGFESGSSDRGQMQWGAVPFSFKYKNIATASTIFVLFNIITLSIVSWLYFNETLSTFQLVGIMFGICSIICLELA
jgi:NADH:ubiquinone oxidoreductase subunit 3 (subunit A)